MRHRIKVLLPIFVMAVLSTGAPLPTSRADDSARRLSQLVEANVIAVHAFQVLLAKQSGKGDKSCFSPGSLSDAELAALSDHQTSLLKSDLGEVRAVTPETVERA